MDRASYQKILEFLRPVIYYLALFFVPLGMSFFLPIYSPFTMVKSAWFQVLASLFLLTYLFSFWLSFKKKRMVVNKEFLISLLPWILFLLALLVLNFFSINQLQSFFGSYDRQLGFLFYFTLAVWFALIVYYFSALNGEVNSSFIFWQKSVNRSVLLMSITASFVSVYACLQFLGYDLFQWQESQLLSRSISSLGQPNFLGSFLLFGLFMTAYLWHLNKKLFHRLLVAIALTIQFFALISSGSRAAWLALLFTIFIYCIIFWWRRWRLKAFILSTAIIISFFAILFITSPSRIQGLFSWELGSLGLRSYFYRAAPTLIRQNIWLGTGLENGGEAIVSSYDPDWGVFMKINGSSDKFHNSLLDALLQLGLFGFFFYLLLYLNVIYQFILLWKRDQTKSFAIFAGAALTAYSFSLLFGLADIVSVFYFWVLAALATAANLIFKVREKENWFRLYFNRILFKFRLKKERSINSIYILLMTILLTIIVSLQIFLSISAIRTDHYFLTLYQYSLNKDYATADLLYSYILEDSFNPIYLQNYQKSYSYFIVEALKQEPGLAVTRYLEKSARQILSDLAPNSYANIHSIANLNCFLNGPTDSLPKFNKLIGISPKKLDNYLSLGDCLARDKADLALSNYRYSLNLLPSRDDHRLIGEHVRYLDFYTYLIYYKIAELYNNDKQYDSALFNYQQAYFFYPSRVDLLENIAKSYYSLGASEKAISSLEHAYLREPNVYWLDRLAALANTAGYQKKLNEYLELRRTISEQDFEYLTEDLIYP